VARAGILPKWPQETHFRDGREMAFMVNDPIVFVLVSPTGLHSLMSSVDICTTVANPVSTVGCGERLKEEGVPSSLALGARGVVVAEMREGVGDAGKNAGARWRRVVSGA
jgi:hypothetical protein